MKEKNFEKKIRRYLEGRGIHQAGQENIEDSRGWYYKVWGGGMQQAGIPDLIANVGGLFLAIEVKGEGGKVSKLQELNIERINEAGGVGIILYPDGFEDFIKIVEVMLSCKSHTQGLSALKTALTSTNYVIGKN